MAHLVCSENKEPNRVPKEGSITHDRCPYGNSPISELIPGQEVSRITEAEGQNEEANSNDPIELPRGPVGPCVEYPDHVKEDRHDHPMGRPTM